MAAALALFSLAAGCNAAGDPTGAAALPATAAVAATRTLPPSTRLVPPPGFTTPVVQSDKKTRDCPTDAPPFTGPLDFPSRYEGSDKARDDVNEKAEKRYRKLIAPIRAMEKGLSNQVDDYMRSGHEESLACALRLLRDWASADGLMGEAITHTGKSMRKWAMGSVAAAYLRLKFSASRPLERDPETMRMVDAWLDRMASRVVLEWQDAPMEKMNNHEYWAAWAVMAAAVALDRRDLFDWAMKQFGIAATQIDSQGYLANELRRDTRALQYHNYALTPLAMIAAFAKANGVPPDAEQTAAMVRLTGRVLDGVEDPEDFEEKTGKKQIVADMSERSKFAWLEPYCWTFSCDQAMQQRRDAMRPLKSYRLGGNLTTLFHPEPSAS